jgi:hypothetical protein
MRLGQAGTIDGLEDVGVNDAECLAEFGCGVWMIDGQEGAEQTAVHLGIENGDADTVGSEHAGVGMRESPDQTFAAQATQVVGHLRRAVAGGE